MFDPHAIMQSSVVKTEQQPFPEYYPGLTDENQPPGAGFQDQYIHRFSGIQQIPDVYEACYQPNKQLTSNRWIKIPAMPSQAFTTRPCNQASVSTSYCMMNHDIPDVGECVTIHDSEASSIAEIAYNLQWDNDKLPHIDVLVDNGYESGSGSPLRQMSPMETMHPDQTEDFRLLDVFEPVTAEQFNYTHENRILLKTEPMNWPENPSNPQIVPNLMQTLPDASCGNGTYMNLLSAVNNVTVEHNIKWEPELYTEMYGRQLDPYGNEGIDEILEISENEDSDDGSDTSGYTTESLDSRGHCGKGKRRKSTSNQPRLWKFLLDALENPEIYGEMISWVDKRNGRFQFISRKKEDLSIAWGEMKRNRCKMTYQKMARALRNYINKGQVLKKIKKKLQYEFLAEFRQQHGEYFQ